MLKQITRFTILIALFPALLCSQKIPLFDFSNFSVYSIEKQIFRLLNGDRESRGLSALKISPDLVALARDQSQDMALQGRLTHVSSDGKTFPDRLVGAGLYFLTSGENAAFSESFSSRLIHQSLLSSPEHRENILNPTFDQVGIGVIYQRDRGYFITQDFLCSFLRKPDKEIKRQIEEHLNDERKRLDLPPIRFTLELDELAANYTQRKVEGKALDKIPEQLGHGKIFISRTPDIANIEEDIKKIAQDRYRTAGLGIAFGRSKKNVGGEYLLVLLLVNRDEAGKMSKESLRIQLFETMNQIRQEKGRKKLSYNTSLSYEADLISSHLRINPREKIALPPRMGSDQLVMYSTNDPFTFSAYLEGRILNARFHTVGIGIVIDPNPDTPKSTYWITFIFD